MLHSFFEPGDWFAAKRFGYGAGLPIAWQGWVILLGYIAVMVGLAWLVETGGSGVRIVSIAAMVLATAGFVFVTKARTRGGWKWRK